MRVTLVVLFVLLPALASAQANRAQSWDFSLGAVYQFSDEVGGRGGIETDTPDTSSLDLDSVVGFGFNATFNLTNQFSVGADLDFLRPDYRLVLVPEDPADETVEIDHRWSQFNGRIKANYAFSDGPLQPFVEGGFGWTYVDSNVADGPPVTGCWWHPWWGYICSGFYRTFDTTEFTYGLGAGLRYDFPGGSFLKGSYSYWELDSGGNSSDFALETIRFEYGWNF